MDRLLDGRIRVAVKQPTSPPASPPSVAERVETIAKLMCRGAWRPGYSHRRLATRWGIAPSMVRTAAAEAARQLREAIGDGEEVRAAILTGIDAIRAAAMKRERVYVNKHGEQVTQPDPDFKAALSCYETQLRALGLIKTLEKSDPAADLADATDEQRIDDLARMVRSHPDLAARLRAALDAPGDEP